MVRTLTGIGLALALVGSAHAQDQQITVKLGGKSPREVRSEIYRAAEHVCATDTAFDPLDTTCIETAYSEAVHKLKAMPRAEQTAYIQASPTSLR